MPGLAFAQGVPTVDNGLTARDIANNWKRYRASLTPRQALVVRGYLQWSRA